MKIITLKECNKKEELYKAWNKEFGFIFPITEELFNKNIINYDDGEHEYSIGNISQVAYSDSDELMGYVIAKVWNREYNVGDYQDTGWISLIYVLPQYRKNGIGSLLLKRVEDIFRALKKKKIYVGRDYDNFFPGVPVDLKSAITWLEHRGYNALYQTQDLVKKVDNKLEYVSLMPYRDNNTYVIRRAEIADYEGLKKMMTTNFSGRWLVEMEDYFKRGGSGRDYLICINGENIVCGFCKIGDYSTKVALGSYNMNYRARFNSLGGIGPLGVDVNYRKRNIAHNLLASCINELAANNATELLIDWTNLLDLYRQFGFEVWKVYTYTSKDLN